MTPLDWAIALAAIALIVFVNWFFLGSEGRAGRRRCGRSQAAWSTSPWSSRAAIRRRPSRCRLASRVRLTLDRREDNPCSDEIVIPDFGIRQSLPAFAKTVPRVHRDARAATSSRAAWACCTARSSESRPP